MSANKKPNTKMKPIFSILLIIGAIVYYVVTNNNNQQQTQQSQQPQQSQPAISLDTFTEPSEQSETSVAEITTQTSDQLEYGEWYSSEEEVALYLELYDELPPNYLTKDEAYDKGWVPQEGNLWEVANGMLIGGDYFGNREGLLPEKNGRNYFEADVNYEGGTRGAERLVYSNDGLIFYTDDHYASFEQLYD